MTGQYLTLVDPTHQYAMAGCYDVVLIGITNFGCTDTATHNICVNEKPTAVLSSDRTEGCPDACIQFTDASLSNANSIVAWDWDLGDGSTSSIFNPQNCYANNQTLVDELYTVTLIVTNDLGCMDTVTMPNYITIHPNPVAAFTAVPEETNEHDSDH